MGYFTMIQTLNDPGYNFLAAFRGTKHSNTCGGEGNNVGIAIFWRGGCFPTTCSQQDDYVHQGNESGNEQRGWVCGYSGAYTAVYCSTHLTSNADVTAAQQSTEYRQKSNGARNTYGLRTAMMGDFNIRPSQDDTGMSLWYNYHHEGDACSTDGDGDPATGCDFTYEVTGGYPTSGLVEKIDIVYVTKGSGFCARGDHSPGWFGNDNFSDHRFYRAYMDCDPVT